MNIPATLSKTADVFCPQRHALALEQRILFDGAAAAAVDQHHADPAHPAGAAEHPAAADPRAPLAALTAPRPAPTKNLVVIDSRVEHGNELLAHLPANTSVVLIKPGEDAVSAVTAALASLGKVDSIQIFSHGAPGQFTLGNQSFTSATIAQMTAVLANWRGELNAGADIELYGCDIGSGASGKALVQELARVTGATVGASSNDTGSAAYGGDWTLEVTSGKLDKPIALSAEALARFDGLLANASPTTTFSAPGGNVLLGDQFSFNVSLTNASTQVGYAPYIDLLVPSGGRRASGACRCTTRTAGGSACCSSCSTNGRPRPCRRCCVASSRRGPIAGTRSFAAGAACAGGRRAASASPRSRSSRCCCSFPFDRPSWLPPRSCRGTRASSARRSTA
nr:DUF4347 domain-containing protein [Paraburkholderia sp. BL8N3]